MCFLGVYTDVKQNLTNSDLNNVKDFGWYIIGDDASPSIINMPMTGGAILDVVGRNTAYTHQFLYYKGSGIIYHRIFNGNSWLDWNELSQDIPSFYKNYSTIRNLTSGIFGGASLIPENSSVSSLSFGIHYAASISTGHISGVPTELKNSGHAITVFVWNYYSNDKSMMLIDIEGGGIWTKMSSSSNWIKV